MLSVTLADGSQIPVCGIGQTHPLPNLSLNFVLFVLGCSFNLISISKLTWTLDYSVLFVNNSILVQDWHTRRTIGVGHEVWRIVPAFTTGGPCSIISPKFAHQRLSHPSLDKLRLLVSSLSIVKSLQCESCQLGKHVSRTCSLCANKRVVSPFALVHSGIWGPSRVCSTLGYFYFVTFIDDFFRCT